MNTELKIIKPLISEMIFEITKSNHPPNTTSLFYFYWSLGLPEVSMFDTLGIEIVYCLLKELLSN